MITHFFLPSVLIRGGLNFLFLPKPLKPKQMFAILSQFLKWKLVLQNLSLPKQVTKDCKVFCKTENCNFNEILASTYVYFLPKPGLNGSSSSVPLCLMFNPIHRFSFCSMLRTLNTNVIITP